MGWMWIFVSIWNSSTKVDCTLSAMLIFHSIQIYYKIKKFQISGVCWLLCWYDYRYSHFNVLWIYVFYGIIPILHSSKVCLMKFFVMIQMIYSGVLHFASGYLIISFLLSSTMDGRLSWPKKRRYIHTRIPFVLSTNMPSLEKL